MNYHIKYSKQFLKDLKIIKKGDPKKIKQISKILLLIQLNPFSKKLHLKKLKGEKDKFRYELGKKYRILVEISIINKNIYFLRIGRRENFY